MVGLRMIVSRCVALFRRRKLDRELDDEMRAHLEMAAEENGRRGMGAEEARRAALREFGGVTQVRETVRLREGWPLIENLRRDVGYAVRQMRRSPGFTAVTVLTLALGIGANTAIFLLTYSLLLKSLPVPDPGRLVRYTFVSGKRGINFSYPLYEALQAHQRETSGVFAWDNDEVLLREGGRSSKIPAGLATGSVFPVLELHPYLGRGFEEKAGERGQPLEHEVLLSYDYWKIHFSGDPRVLGQALNLNGAQMAIVGVLPRGFDGISPEQRIGLLLPLSFQRVLQPKYSMMDEPGAFWLVAMGRLKPGATLDQARAALQASDKQIEDDADPQRKTLTPDLFGGGFRLSMGPGRTGESWLRQTYTKPLVALEALCGLMMLLCAVNAALLVLSRVSGRLHEFAVRSALGAARGRLMRQVLMETALLGTGGLLLGGWLGWELAHGLVAIITSIGDAPALDLKAGAMVVLFAVGVSLTAALLAGLWPAWRASRTAPALDLKQGRTQIRAGSLGRWMIPTQVALGVVLIYAAVLMTGTLRSYLKENSGFRPDGVTLARVNYQSDDPSDLGQVRKAFEIAEDLRQQPGVESATLMSAPPVSSWMMNFSFFTRDPKGAVHYDNGVWREEVSQGYFATMGTRILEGRGFAESDAGGDPVCVISRATANFFFPGENPLGRFITNGDGKPPKKTGSDDHPPIHYRVIGVAEDARMQSLLEQAPMTLYGLYAQEKKPWVPEYLAVRSHNDALAAEAVRRTAARILPGAEAPVIFTFKRTVEDDLNRQRLLSSVSGGFALLALALVGAGLYGVLARAVTERRREIGIRMALGAQRDRIVAALARGALVRIGVGVAVGAGLAVLTGRLLRSLLYGVSAASPLAGFMTLGLLLLVLLAAFVVPAARAASVHPMEAIREE